MNIRVNLTNVLPNYSSPPRKSRRYELPSSTIAAVHSRISDDNSDDEDSNLASK